MGKYTAPFFIFQLENKNVQKRILMHLSSKRIAGNVTWHGFFRLCTFEKAVVEEQPFSVTLPFHSSNIWISIKAFKSCCQIFLKHGIEFWFTWKYPLDSSRFAQKYKSRMSREAYLKLFSKGLHHQLHIIIINTTIQYTMMYHTVTFWKSYTVMHFNKRLWLNEAMQEEEVPKRRFIV